MIDHARLAELRAKADPADIAHLVRNDDREAIRRNWSPREILDVQRMFGNIAMERLADAIAAIEGPRTSQLYDDRRKRLFGKPIRRPAANQRKRLAA